MKSTRSSAILAVAAMLAWLVASPGTSAAASHARFFTGTVVHVSRANIKVESKKEALSFLLAPAFKQVYSSAGKTRYPLSAIKPGMLVRIRYDQRLLGARHADAIFIVSRR